VVALSTVEVRVDRDPVCYAYLGDGRPDRHHLAGQLVAGHDRVRGGDFTVHDVQIGAADAAADHAHHHFSRSGRRVRHGLDLDRARCGDHCRAHRVPGWSWVMPPCYWLVAWLLAGRVATGWPRGAGPARRPRPDPGHALGCPAWRRRFSR